MSLYERNLIHNGRFDNDINGWESTNGAAFAELYGFEVPGCLLSNQALDEVKSQSFTVPRARQYLLHFALNGVAAALTAFDFEIYEDGVTHKSWSVQTLQAAQWYEFYVPVGLAPSRSYQVGFVNDASPQSIYLDAVWLWPVAINRAEVAARVEDKLGSLAADLSLSAMPSGAKPEGDYSYPIDEAMYRLGAINPLNGKPDIRWVEDNQVPQLLDLTYTAMLEKVQSEYAGEVDVKAGPISESLSQKSKNIGEILTGKSQSGGPIVTRRLTRDDWYA